MKNYTVRGVDRWAENRCTRRKWKRKKINERRNETEEMTERGVKLPRYGKVRRRRGSTRILRMYHVGRKFFV